ncbi:MAG: tRNA (guanosine(37)-N1)-methyltransferase TrmD [Pseudobdellovibrionaceae bacterium]
MIHFNVISIFPEFVSHGINQGVVGQALKKGIISLTTVTPREYTSDFHKTVDDRPFGGGDGMIMLYEPLNLALKNLAENKRGKVIYLSPQGKKLDQAKVVEFSKEQNLTLVCGRYGGVDQRFINEWVDEEVSIGDYVISGGELGALVLIDAVSRQVPGVLGHSESSIKDSFSDSTLEHPQFTRPRVLSDQSVPEILLSGDHKKIDQWKKKVSLLVTLQKRPDLVDIKSIDSKEKTGLRDFFKTLSNQDKSALGLEKFDLSEYF